MQVRSSEGPGPGWDSLSPLWLRAGQGEALARLVFAPGRSTPHRSALAVALRLWARICCFQHSSASRDKNAG